jgi:hypothetical protein
MVIVIAGILTMATVPPLQSAFTTARLNGACTELASGLQYAANLAVRYQRPFGLFADTAGNGFCVYDVRYRSDVEPHPGAEPPVDRGGIVLNPADRRWYDVRFGPSTPFDGVSLFEALPGPDIWFYPDGHATQGAYAFALRSGQAQRAVNVDGITGYVSVH